MTNDSSNGKPLRTISFVIHATRGVVRDQVVRRTTMFALLVVALLLLFSGSTFLQGVINQRAHPLWFVLFWLVCAWLTITAMMLALFDLFLVHLACHNAMSHFRES